MPTTYSVPISGTFSSGGRDSNRDLRGYELDPLDRLDYVELGFKRFSRDWSYVEIGWNPWAPCPSEASGYTWVY